MSIVLTRQRQAEPAVEVHSDRSDSLETRLQFGADLLLQMEQQGDRGPDYRRMLSYWTRLLEEYEDRAA